MKLPLSPRYARSYDIFASALILMMLAFGSVLRSPDLFLSAAFSMLLLTLVRSQSQRIEQLERRLATREE